MIAGRPRSHPPTLIRLVECTLREECGVRRGERILVATSGGGDSTALLHTLALAASKIGFSVLAHGVDHGLRPEAAGELDLVEAFATRLGVPFERTSVACPPGGNLQARARALRRQALEAAADRRGATRIATAHHGDDRAETVLIRLLNGAPPAGLAVLPPTDGRWIRPMIFARKADIAAHLSRHCLEYASDPSNLNRRFLRVRIRMELMPLLEDLSPGVVSHLNMLADELAAGRAPEIADAAGRPIPLRRAHVRELRRASRLGRRLTIRLSGARDVAVEPVPRTRANPGTAPTKGEKRPKVKKKAKKGGAKSKKSG